MSRERKGCGGKVAVVVNSLLGRREAAGTRIRKEFYINPKEEGVHGEGASSDVVLEEGSTSGGSINGSNRGEENWGPFMLDDE